MNIHQDTWECPNCKKETLHTVVGTIFSGDRTCTVCGWTRDGMRGVYEPPPTAIKFKPGDKVYIHPGRPSWAFIYYIRGVVVSVDKTGYFCKAWECDLPGIWTFNIWDYDLLPRTSKKNKPLPLGDISGTVDDVIARRANSLFPIKVNKNG